MQYLWFFVAVLSGEAIKESVGGIGTMTRLRGIVKIYPHIMLWHIFLILLIFEIWVAAFQISQEAAVHVGLFAMFAMLPLGVALAAYQLQPAKTPDEDSAVNFNRTRVTFFIVLAALPALSIFRQLVVGHGITFDMDLTFRLIVMCGLLLGIWIKGLRRETIHASVMIAIVVIYLFALYSTVLPPLTPIEGGAE